eukprot:CAMPEP_0179928118 /NCGR_PEP_ID=MMETSP0983-20121128/8694_1 /TAXON_ID=483367 /ORGANISM="non described non described, Strain CCMP 2436" /LENGTH=98 /DNA_ID=CAMNT_0021831895 /DNA_START=165 /DNA_END=462 /DNA_ORIENTATION=+
MPQGSFGILDLREELTGAVRLAVEDLDGLRAEEPGDHVDAERDHGCHQEGEGDRDLRDARDGHEDAHNHGLVDGEARHLAPVDVLHVVIRWPALTLEG